MTVSKSVILIALALAIGLLAGFSGAILLGGFTKTVARYYTSYSTLTITSPTILTKTVIKTVKEHEILTNIVTSTVSMIKTQTITRTLTATQSMSMEQTSSVTTVGGVLMTDTGSGEKNTKAFTLARTSDIKISFHLTGGAKVAFLYWYLYPVGAELYEFVGSGRIDKSSGDFDFYVYALPPGRYYLKISSMNVEWKVIVTSM